jgi:transposase
MKRWVASRKLEIVSRIVCGGESVDAVAAEISASADEINAWVATFKRDGEHGLRMKAMLGGRPKRKHKARAMEASEIARRVSSALERRGR